MRMPAGRPGCGYAQVALLHSKAPTLPPDVLRHQPPEKNNLVRNDLLEGTSRRSRDEILEAAGHQAHVTRRIAGPSRSHRTLALSVRDCPAPCAQACLVRVAGDWRIRTCNGCLQSNCHQHAPPPSCACCSGPSRCLECGGAVAAP